MATTIVMDTHKLIERLKKSGFSQEQATGITEALQEIDLSQLSTKADLRDVELRLIKWMATIVGIGVAILALLIQLART